MRKKQNRVTLTDKELELIETIRLLKLNVYPMNQENLILTAQQIFDELIEETQNY